MQEAVSLDNTGRWTTRETWCSPERGAWRLRAGKVEEPHDRRLHEEGAASRLLVVADAVEQKARRAIREAQARFKREQSAARKARREAFAEAQKAGLTLRDIGEEAGLHHTRVLKIIRGE
jgi:hypothetical protein